MSTSLDHLIACPKCDALHEVSTIAYGEKACCRQCHTVLIHSGERVFVQVITLALTVLILMVAAIFFPFLQLQAGEIEHHSSVFDAITAFSSGLMLPLSFAVAALIVFIPIARVVAVIYTLWPLMQGRAPYRYATHAMRLAEVLKPWSMAEIFIIGVAVALVKIGGIAQVSLGPAFWAFVALVIVVALQDTFTCKWTIWKSLENKNNS